MAPRIQLFALFSYLLGASSSFCQAYVIFENARPDFITTADRLVYADVVGGTKLVGTNYVAQLYYGTNGTSESNLNAVTNAPIRFRPATTQLPGTWLSGGTERFLLGFQRGDQLTLQVRVWDGSLFATYEQAVVAGGVHGQSDPFGYDVPLDPIYLQGLLMDNLRAFALNLPLTSTNHAPVAYPQSKFVALNKSAAVNLVALDVDGDSLTYTLTSPAHGVLTGTPPQLEYVPDQDFIGGDSFTFQVSDGRLQSAVTSVSLETLAGGTVYFENYVLFFVTAADRLVYADVVGGTKLVGTNYFAQLYYGADPNNLIPVTNAPAQFRPLTTLDPGAWNTPTFDRLLLGFIPGDEVILQVKVWDGSRFNTYEDAVAAAGVHGQSAPFEYDVPSPHSTSLFLFSMENLRAFALGLPMITPNSPPVAVARAFAPSLLSSNGGNPVVLAPNNSNAVVVLDGALSADSEHDPLQYSWIEAGASLPFASGARVTNLFDLGIHTVSLEVSDATGSGTATFTVTIIPAETAVKDIATQVANLPRRTEHLLLHDLTETQDAFDRNHFEKGIHYLQQFQEDVLERKTLSNPVVAQELVALAQSIIDAFSRPLIIQIEELRLAVDNSSLHLELKRILLEELAEAAADFTRNEFIEGSDELREFQKKVHHQVPRADQATGLEFIEAAQKIIDACGGM